MGIYESTVTQSKKTNCSFEHFSSLSGESLRSKVALLILSLSQTSFDLSYCAGTKKVFLTSFKVEFFGLQLNVDRNK